MTMTLEEMKLAIVEAETKARETAEKMKAKRDDLRTKADKAHKDYIEFCKGNGIPVRGKQAKTSGEE